MTSKLNNKEKCVVSQHQHLINLHWSFIANGNKQIHKTTTESHQQLTHLFILLTHVEGQLEVGQGGLEVEIRNKFDKVR